jgi:3-dehydroquinate dehydratase II
VSSVLVLNGPNLNRLGSREPDVYGTATLADIEDAAVELATELGLTLDFRQTNDEAECIDWLHEAADTAAGVIINPAAFTHYSYAIRDACALVPVPLIEVHLSNPSAREEFRHTSVIAGVATGTIAGFGPQSYLLAVRAMAGLLESTR